MGKVPAARPRQILSTLFILALFTSVQQVYCQCYPDEAAACHKNAVCRPPVTAATPDPVSVTAVDGDSAGGGEAREGDANDDNRGENEGDAGSDPGGSVQCVCKPGFTGNGTECDDDNECMDGNHRCRLPAECTNKEGGYSCECPVNHIKHSDGKACLHVESIVMLTDSSSPGIVDVGIHSTVTLVCRFRAAVLDTVTWAGPLQSLEASDATVVSERMSGNIFGSNLTLTSVASIDTGVYSCTASNKATQATHSMHLRVITNLIVSTAVPEFTTDQGDSRQTDLLSDWTVIIVASGTAALVFAAVILYLATRVKSDKPPVTAAGGPRRAVAPHDYPYDGSSIRGPRSAGGSRTPAQGVLSRGFNRVLKSMESISSTTARFAIIQRHPEHAWPGMFDNCIAMDPAPCVGGSDIALNKGWCDETGYLMSNGSNRSLNSSCNVSPVSSCHMQLGSGGEGDGDDIYDSEYLTVKRANDSRRCSESDSVRSSMDFTSDVLYNSMSSQLSALARSSSSPHTGAAEIVQVGLPNAVWRPSGGCPPGHQQQQRQAGVSPSESLQSCSLLNADGSAASPDIQADHQMTLLRQHQDPPHHRNMSTLAAHDQSAQSRISASQCPLSSPPMCPRNFLRGSASGGSGGAAAYNPNLGSPLGSPA
eukprot:scpid37992/ scgid9149/ 